MTMQPIVCPQCGGSSFVRNEQNQLVCDHCGSTFKTDDNVCPYCSTINPARAIGIDHRVGSIEAGKDADLVIKGGSLFDVTIPVDMVFINGEIAYRGTQK